MTIGLILPLSCLFFSILLMAVYFSRKTIDNYENTIYKRLIVVNFISLLMEFVCTFFTYNEIPFISKFIIKIYLCILITYMLLLTLYISYVSKSGDVLNEKWVSIRKFYLIIYAVFAVAILFSDINLNITNLGASADGVGTVITAIFSLLCPVSWIYNVMVTKKKENKKKYAPFVLYLILSFIVLFVQKICPGLLLITSSEALVTMLMYFTIENPDIHIINQLENAKSQAEKANRAKTDFLSSMSHEIRTPLNAIVGFSDCINNTNSLEEAKENAKDIVNASNTLLEIVNGILDISKIEAGKLEITNSSYNAKNVLEELAKLITPKMKEKGLDFSYSIADDLPSTLYGDHANLRKIITNLLSNACKYTDSGFVRYTVNCVNTDNVCKLIISVEDSGRGIKKENIDKLFTKFQRLDEDKNTTIEGTGLGLAITKQLVELMGGKIVVHTVYGEGSKFTVVINQRIEKCEIKEEKVVVSTSLNLRDIKILIVDDNALNLKVATKLLERFGALNIECVDSGFYCLDKINNGEKYDVILMDDMMPKMSGVETLHKLKENSNFDTPVIALTANAISGMREKYLSEGFDDYLAKPIEKEELIKVMNIILKEKVSVSNKNSSINLFSITQENDVNIDTDYGISYLKNNGVDLDKSLELLGDIEMFNTTLKDFFDTALEKWEKIVKYKENIDLDNYSIMVHSLKSDSKYLGFIKFSELAYEHELKSKDRDISFINRHFKEFNDEFNRILLIIKNYLN